MGEMRIMDRAGDSVLAWNPEELEEVREAEARFNELVVRGRHTAFDIVEGGKAKQLKVFNPDAEKIVMVPRVAGG